MDRPRDFTGHSMSVGDIIVVNDKGNPDGIFC
ncbi:MAG: YodL domain-containing protein [Ruminococcus sp.]